MLTYVILNDGDTFTGVKGCKVVRIYELNEAAVLAAEEGDGGLLLALADEVIDIESSLPLLSGYDVKEVACSVSHDEKRHVIPHTKGCEWA